MPSVWAMLCHPLLRSSLEYEKCLPSKNVALMLILQWDLILTLGLPLRKGGIGCARLSKPVNGLLTVAGVWSCRSICDLRGGWGVREACPPGQGPNQECWDTGLIAYRCPFNFPQVNSIYPLLGFTHNSGRYAQSQNGETSGQGALALCVCSNGE